MIYRGRYTERNFFLQSFVCFGIQGECEEYTDLFEVACLRFEKTVGDFVGDLVDINLNSGGF
jgi:hypothetical protein